MTSRPFLLFLATLCLSAQAIDVGSGAPDTVTAGQFVTAFFRGNFSNAVSTPPVGEVRRFGTGGYIQEFQDANKTSGVRLALIKPATASTVEGTSAVFQVLALSYAYYSSVGVGTAGFPTMDTAACANSAPGTCFYQIFDKRYALFAYASALANGSSTFTVKDPFYTEWLNGGAIQTFGAATSAETAITSVAGSVGTAQLFQNGAVINITGGTLSGKLVSVRTPVWEIYNSNGGPSGFLGFPTGPEIVVGNNRRQVFEGGAIDYTPGGSATLRLPVATVNIATNVTTLRLKLNETATIEAIPRAANGDPLLDRTVSFVSTNGRVVSIQANGRTATLKAVGGGVATVTAVSEGKISTAIAVSVQAPCCQIGEGAPNATQAQAFSDAVTRNRLTLQLPGANPVRRAGNGYTQEFLTVAGARVLLALPDRSAQAWMIAGPILSRFDETGGASGVIGYPSADPTVGGRQLFENAALAGTPVQVVSGPVLTRWALLGYETGAAGPPTGPAVPFANFAASAGVQQSFRDGLIVNIQSGANASKAFLVSGVIARRYIELGGAGGRLGAPNNEEFTLNGQRRQDFEGGYMEYPVGGGAVNVVENARRPTVSAVPSSAIAGSRIRLSIGGFPDNASLRVSVTGQADFNVRVRNGSYSWDAWIPPDATTRTITVRAVDTATNVVAETTYSIRAAIDARPRLTKVRGDAQSGAPGTRLPIPLRVNLRDETGVPLVGVSVTFEPSSGASLSATAVPTDINGDAESSLRLPAAEGIVLATARASNQVVTFTARITGTSVSSFPRVTFDGNSYVGSAAAVLKYFQDRAELGGSGGAVTPAALDTYLRNFCTLDNQANQICDGYLADPDTPNLWRLINFAGGGLELVPVAATDVAIREALAGGTPVLVSLRLANGAGLGVVATGVSAAGELSIMDPSPRQPKSTLSELTASGATLAGAVRFQSRAAAASGFLLTARAASAAVTSPAGPCGPAFSIPFPEGATQFAYCDGSQSIYQAELSAPAAYRGTLTDLAAGGPRYDLNGLRSGIFRVSKPGTVWELAPLETSFQAAAVLNAASFQPDFSPGSAISVFGLGLARTGIPTTVEVGGREAQVLFATPFQLNAALPLDLPPGTWPLRITSAYGAAEVQIDVRDAAPAIFRLTDTLAAVTNQDASINAPNNPAARGQVIVAYGTGFGAVQEAQGALRRTAAPVTARVAGVDLTVVYSGLTPGSIGLYQINIQLPANLPPGLFQSLEITQGGVTANPVPVAIR